MKMRFFGILLLIWMFSSLLGACSPNETNISDLLSYTESGFSSDYAEEESFVKDKEVADFNTSKIQNNSSYVSSTIEAINTEKKQNKVEMNSSTTQSSKDVSMNTESNKDTVQSSPTINSYGGIVLPDDEW